MTRKALLLLLASLSAGFVGGCGAGHDDLDLDVDEESSDIGDGSRQSGETIVRWNDHNLAILTTLDSGAAAGLQLIRDLANVHVAMHDAANGARHKYEKYALKQVDWRADPTLAAAAAAHAALIALRPGKAAQVNAFLQTDLDRVKDPDRRQRSLDLGAAAADAILTLRGDDGFFDVVPHTFGPPAPGVWQPVPPADTTVAIGTQLPFVTPMALTSADQFRVPPPPALSSVTWKRDYDEVKEVGRSDSTVRTTDQTAAALFWREQAQFAWNRIARIAASERDQGLWQTARAFALVNVGIMDGVIAIFDTKYHYEYWRPYTTIREVDDVRSDTLMDPAWESLIPTPGHPEYNSAHSVLGGVASYPLSQIYGNHFAFELTTATAEPAGSTRSYSSFFDAAIDGALSRIWGGIHFRSSTVPGVLQGRAIGAFIYDHELGPD